MTISASTASLEDLKRIIEGATFEPSSALALAQEVSQIAPRGEASFVRFMAHAEVFAKSGEEADSLAAVEAYREAVELEPGLHLFPTKYQVVRLLGVGGFSYVFQVVSGGARLSLKVFKARISLPEVTRAKFAEELAKLGTAECAHILKVFDTSGLLERPAHFVTEYFEGQSLRKVVRGGTFRVRPGSRLSLEKRVQLVEIALQIAEALDASHKVDVLHLDLKPENVLVSKESQRPRVKVLDFNSLTVEHAGLPLQSLSVIQHTIQYSAPEVVDEVNRSAVTSDVYSFGLTMIELLAGDLTHRSIFEALTGLASQEPQLAVLLLSCIDPTASHRPQSFGTLVRQLSEHQANLNEQVRRYKLREETASFRAMLRAFVGGLAGPIHDLLEIIQGKPIRQLETTLAVMGFVFLFLSISGTLFGFDHWSVKVNREFLPCALVVYSFAALQLMFYMNIMLFTQFHRWMVGSIFRFLMSISAFGPILFAVHYPRYWPFAAAVGVAFVAANNNCMWRYARAYRYYSPSLFERERADITTTLFGYQRHAALWCLGLVSLGVVLLIDDSGPEKLWWINLMAGSFVLAVNLTLYFTKTSGDSAHRIINGLAIERAIRAHDGVSSNTATREHPVIAEIKRRLTQSPDTLQPSAVRLGLVVEGGGMRGIIGAGAVVGLEQAGCTAVFDDVYGESAGAMNACYFLAGEAQLGVRIYTEDLSWFRFINLKQPSKLLDMDLLVDKIMRSRKPLSERKVIESRSRMFVSLTDATTGEQRVVDIKKEGLPLLDVLKASGAIVPLYNHAVIVDGRPYVDGGIADPIPIKNAIKDGCTHILVILTRSRRFVSPAGRWYERLAMRALLHKWPSDLKHAFIEKRYKRYNEARALAFGDTPPPRDVFIAVLCPEEGRERISRMSVSARALKRAREESVHRTRRLFTN